MCNQCGVVCPVRIPLPIQLSCATRRSRRIVTARRPAQRAAQRPALYGFGSKLAVRLLKAWGGRDGLIQKLPIGSGWTEGRDLPAPAGKTFRELYRAKAQGRVS
jgi:L-lactate dehydrogenase complex protein LldF